MSGTSGTTAIRRPEDARNEINQRLKDGWSVPENVIPDRLYHAGDGITLVGPSGETCFREAPREVREVVAGVINNHI